MNFILISSKTLDKYLIVPDKGTITLVKVSTVLVESVSEQNIGFFYQVLSHRPKSFRNYWIKVFDKAAKTVNRSEYTSLVDHMMEKLGTLGKDFINNSNPESWATSLFRGKRWGIYNNNTAESWNSWVREARMLPIVPMLDDIRRKVMVMMNDKREDSYKQVSYLCNNPEKKLKNNIDESRTLQVAVSCGWKFEVTDGGDKFDVDLTAKTCSCKIYQFVGIPCKHACSCILSLQQSPYAFCDSYYTLHMYKEAYMSYINPIPTNVEIASQLPEDVREPDVPRPPGRPRTKRIPSQVEDVRPLKCGRCSRSGHNRRTCKEPI